MSGSSELVQRQLDAYNAHDIDAFLACYADDAVLAGLNGDVTHRGLAAIRKRHEDLFYEFPRNHAKLVNRIDLGTTVIDHEQVERAPGGDRFEVAAIYTIKAGKIARVDFARAGAV
ncbi:SgcJ/EcaC family oxidoreductase [Hyphomonas sp.]|uniref:nuclear transport factor 2 family protein n=1 Tax=Hyphomonas sp. TaxID=87 RepID=UPI00391C63CC